MFACLVMRCTSLVLLSREGPMHDGSRCVVHVMGLRDVYDGVTISPLVKQPGEGKVTTMEVTKTTAMALLIAGVDVLRRELDRGDLPSQTIVCFCHIAMRNEMPMNDLIDLMDVSNAAVSRNVNMLGIGTPREPGLGLVDAYEDPEFRRRKLVKLTTKGAKLRDKVTEGMIRKLFIKGGKNGS